MLRVLCGSFHDDINVAAHWPKQVVQWGEVGTSDFDRARSGIFILPGHICKYYTHERVRPACSLSCWIATKTWPARSATYRPKGLQSPRPLHRLGHIAIALGSASRTTTNRTPNKRSRGFRSCIIFRLGTYDNPIVALEKAQVILQRIRRKAASLGECRFQTRIRQRLLINRNINFAARRQTALDNLTAGAATQIYVALYLCATVLCNTSLNFSLTLWCIQAPTRLDPSLMWERSWKDSGGFAPPS